MQPGICTEPARRAATLSVATVVALTTLAVATAGAQTPVQTAIQDRMGQLESDRALAIGESQIAAVRAMPDFYARREWWPAWVEPGAVDDLLRAIDDAEHHGLSPADYHRDALTARRAALSGTSNAAPEKLAALDLLFTDALMRLCYHTVFGKVDPESLDPNWNLTRAFGDVDPVTMIQHSIDSGALYDFVQSLAPQHRYYERLAAALAEYRQLAAGGGWPGVSAGETLKPGVTSPRVAEVRARLAVTGELEGAATSSPDDYDAALEEAVKRFQERHRLAADGVIGKDTVTELDTPVERRIEQIRVNLERGRWILHDVEDTFVLANIAGFAVGYVKNDQLVWTSKAQVGKLYRKTPLFKSELKYIVFNPTWTVPPTILRKDVLPAIKKDPSYLARKHMEVLDHSGKKIDPASIDWSKVSGKSFPYIIRQTPGPHNALGLVKFIFPNKHFVFLHDTPSRSLFTRDSRAFSSGCVRVENPFDLAELLLEGSEWDRSRIDALVESGETKTVYLKKPLPVLLLYWTARVDDDGRMAFVRDVYERDDAILDQLNAPMR